LQSPELGMDRSVIPVKNLKIVSENNRH